MNEFIYQREFMCVLLYAIREIHLLYMDAIRFTLDLIKNA